MRDRFFLVPLLLGGLTGCQSFKERLFSPLTTRLDLVNTSSARPIASSGWSTTTSAEPG